MIRWLDDNPLGKVLASVSAALLAVLLLLALAWSLPPRGSDGEGDDEGRDLSVSVPQLAPTDPIEEFAVITERPVFNESRQPELAGDAGGEGEGEGEEWAEVQVDAPEVELAGVVITPSQKMATLRPKGGPESLIALEGSPLEGDYGSWHVATIEPRSVVLRSGDGEEVRLELQVHDALIKQPPKPPPQTSDQRANPAADAGEDAEPPLSRAEEIRQRIAERREELRRAAEEKEQNGNENKQPDYRSAIQQLIQGKRTEAKDENEQ